MMITTSEIADFIPRYTLKESIDNDPLGNALLVQAKDLSFDEGVNWASATCIKYDKSEGFLKAGDVLFVGRGSRFYATLASNPPTNAIASSQLFVLRVNPQVILPNFFVFYLNSKETHKYYAKSMGRTTVPFISQAMLAAMPISLPPLSQQMKIVKLLQLMHKQKRLNTQIAELKEIQIEAILNEMQKDLK